MRWIWLDRFEEFVPGTRAVGIKNVTLAEDHLHDHFPGCPMMPASLLIEGMAQTAGILVGHAREFKEKVILAKLKRAVFHGVAVPGDQVRLTAHLEQITDAGASTRGEVHVGDRLVGEVDLFFSHIDQNLRGLQFPEENFVFDNSFMALLRTYMERDAERIRL